MVYSQSKTGRQTVHITEVHHVMILKFHCNIRNSNIVVLFFQYFKEFSLYSAFELIFLRVLIEGGILFQIKAPEIEKARFKIFSSNLFSIV